MRNQTLDSTELTRKQHPQTRSQPLIERTRSFVASWILVALLVVTPIRAADHPAEDLLATAFDATTGKSFATTMLTIIKTGEHSQQDPAVLDARLQAVEAALSNLTARFQIVEQRLAQVENEVAHQANIQRLRKLEQVATELAEITAELKAKPSDPVARRILEFRARQQADLIKNDPNLDIWKMTDVTADGVRTRFFVYPAFETYALSLTTWFSAIEFALPPQQLVDGFGSALRAHQTFLETRPGFVDQRDAPLSLLENLQTAAFCHLEAVDKFSNNSGACVFASVCIDTMTETSAETDRVTLTVQPPVNGTLCTSNPNQSLGLKGEDDLRKKYGSDLMAELAHGLDRLATTGSLSDAFVGQFPNFIMAQLFSVPLDGPLLAGAGATPGALPAIPECRPLVGGGCSFGVQLSQQTGWTIAHTNPTIPGGHDGLNFVRHNGSNLCLDVKANAAVAAAEVNLWPCNHSASQVWNFVTINNAQFKLVAGSSGLCATVVPAGHGPLAALSRGLTLQPCNQGDLQKFSTSDSTLPGPH